MKIMDTNRQMFVLAFILPVIGFSLLFPAPLHAQQDPVAITLLAEKEQLGRGDMLAVEVYVRADVPINALDLELAYSTKNLDDPQIRDGGSIVDVWGEKRINHDGIIRLRGGLTRPFSGEFGTVVRIVFTATKEGVGQVSLRRGEAYRADGRGTPVSLSSSFVSIPIVGTLGGNITLSRDDTPPTLMSQIAVNPAGESIMLVANAEDDESGVENMQVRTKAWGMWTPWRIYQNPQPIPKDVWAIALRANNFDGGYVENVHYRWSAVFIKMLSAAGVAGILLVAMRLCYRSLSKK